MNRKAQSDGGGGIEAIDEVARRLGPRARRGVPLGPLTTYRVGGPAALYVEATTEQDLIEVARAISGSGVQVLVVGNGSNLLVADRGFPGVALTLTGDWFSRVDIEAGSMVRAGGIASLPSLARRTAAAGLTGLEWAVGVPGSVGGAVYMNAGGHGSDTSQVIVECGLIDVAAGVVAAEVTCSAAELDFAYRRSKLAASEVVVWARFQLRPGDPDESAATIREIVRWHREHQPGGQNAGSVFANPPDDSAGRLIDSVGLKGLRRRSAQVSEKHANFFQADSDGSADDVYELAQEVQHVVEARTGVRLTPEVRMVGFEDREPSSLNRGLGS